MIIEKRYMADNLNISFYTKEQAYDFLNDISNQIALPFIKKYTIDDIYPGYIVTYNDGDYMEEFKGDNALLEAYSYCKERESSTGEDIKLKSCEISIDELEAQFQKIKEAVV